MKVYNFGSLNIDHVYCVDHISRPGETISSTDYAIYPGGKGANQSVAVARAGGTVLHVGRIGRDGLWMVEDMKRDGVDTTHTMVSEHPSGHALIQVDAEGQNSIVIHGGTNREIDAEQVDAVLAEASAEDMVLLQNEINNIPYVIEAAAAKGMGVCINPAPMEPAVRDYPLDKVSLLIVNESEGESLTGLTDSEEIVSKLRRRYPRAQIILTMGSRGAVFEGEDERCLVEARRVEPVDTTAAGDVFVGYFLAGLQQGRSNGEAMAFANNAASISVTRKGASSSIPTQNEVNEINV